MIVARNVSLEIEKNRRLRVAHVLQPTTGGVPRVAVLLADAGRQRGHDVVVFAPDSSDFAAELDAAGIKWRRLPMTRRPSFSDLGSIIALRLALPEFDIVHLHSSKAAAVGRLAALGRRRAPRVVVVPHAWSWLAGKRARPVYQWFERRLRSRADLFVAVSQGECDAGRAVLGAEVPIRIITNGVDVDRFRPPTTPPSSAGTNIVLVGRLCLQKGQDRALRALSYLPEQFTLTLVGDGPVYDSLVALARSLGVTPRVTFVGAADPRPHLQAADILLVASRWEGLSLSMLEGMACALPVVTTDVAGAEVVAADCGIRVPAEAAPKEIAEALSTLTGDPANQESMREASRERVVSSYSARRMVDDYAELWAELAP